MALSNKDEAEVKAIRDMLDEGDNQLNELLGQIPSSYVYVLDGDGRLLYANPKFAKAMSEPNPNMLIGKLYYDLLDSTTAEGQRASNQKVLDTKKDTLNTQDTFVRKDGRTDAVCTQKSYTLVLDNPAVITISAVMDKIPKGGVKRPAEETNTATESAPAKEPTKETATETAETAEKSETVKTTATATDTASEPDKASEDRPEEPESKRTKTDTEETSNTAATE